MSTSRFSTLTPEQRWPVVVLGLLLLAQAAGLFSLGSSYLFNLTPEQLFANLPSLLNSSAFNLLALLAVIAAIGFLRLRRLGWLCAMLLQGLCLLLVLGLYLGARPGFVYWVMAYSVGMVVYLNTSNVQAAFRPKIEILDPRDAQ
jgi:hypothetical protein